MPFGLRSVPMRPRLVRLKYGLLCAVFATALLSPLRCSRWSGSRWIKNTGDVAEVVMPCVTTAVLLLKNDFFLLPHWFTAGATTALSVHVLKYTIPARRPNGGRHSFPSGHTATAFVSAGFLLRHYGLRWGIPVSLLAAFVGFSRIDSRSHYLRDVLAGALLGLFWAWISQYLYLKVIACIQKKRRRKT